MSIIDNISYAREIFGNKKKIVKVGEHVIEKSALDTIIGLLCIGDIPQSINVTIGSNYYMNAVIDCNARIDYNFMKHILASYLIIKDQKTKVGRRQYVVSNINIIGIMKLLSSGTTYKSITEKDGMYLLYY